MTRLAIIILSAICTLILGAGLLIYFCHFNNGWSTNHDAWGAFGDFYGVFVNLANLVIVILIAIFTIRASNKIADLQLELSKSQLKIEQLKVVPHIYLTEKRSNVATQDSWFVQHTGEGPAINILVRFKSDRNGQFTRWISCLSLGTSDERELVWLRNADTIELCYCDITEENCFLYTFQDRIGRTIKISFSDYKSFISVAINNNLNTHPDLVTRYLNGGSTDYSTFFGTLL